MEQVMNQYYIGVDSYGEPYIVHWGIKGQKWGIRRYQNPDGSLTEAGKKRYGKQLADDLKIAESVMKRHNDNSAAMLSRTTNLVLGGNHAVTDFEDRSETRKKLVEIGDNLRTRTQEYNKQINAKLVKKYGQLDLDSPEQVAKYIKEGQSMMNKMMQQGDTKVLLSEYNNLSKKYEEESRAYLDELLGEYGNQPVPAPMLVKYDTKTQQFGRQTYKDVAGIEMLRRAGGAL